MITRGYYLKDSGLVLRVDNFGKDAIGRPTMTYTAMLMRRRCGENRKRTTLVSSLERFLVRALTPEEIEDVTRVVFVKEHVRTESEREFALRSYKKAVSQPNFQTRLSSISIPEPESSSTLVVLSNLIDKGLFTRRDAGNGAYKFREAANGWNGFLTSEFLNAVGTKVSPSLMTEEEKKTYDRIVESLLPVVTGRIPEELYVSTMARSALDLAEAVAKEWIGRKRKRTEESHG